MCIRDRSRNSGNLKNQRKVFEPQELSTWFQQRNSDQRTTKTRIVFPHDKYHARTYAVSTKSRKDLKRSLQFSNMWQLSNLQIDSSVIQIVQSDVLCNLMLEGLSHEYKILRETLVVFCPNDPSFIETKVRERYLDLQTQGGPKKHSSVCLLYTSPSPRDKRQSRMPSSA